MPQGHKVQGKLGSGRSTLGDSFSDRDDLDVDEALLQAAAEKKAVSREKSKLEVEARKILFVHVRLNRVHCRVTYQVFSQSIGTCIMNISGQTRPCMCTVLAAVSYQVAPPLKCKFSCRPPPTYVCISASLTSCSCYMH